MRVLIDGDGFPDVKDIIELCKKHQTKVIVYIDLNHVMNSDYATVNFISPGTNAVDLVIQNECQKDDLVLTNDYGVAIIALSKKAKCLNANGYFYTNNNIDYLMDLRFINSKERLHHNIKGPKKRTKDNKINLLKEIEIIIGESNEKEK